MIARLRETSQSLTFRIAALLALALLPIGLISVATTSKVLRAADRNAEINLLALTAEAAAPEEAFVRTGIGAASMMAAMVPSMHADAFDCTNTLAGFLHHVQAFSFIGYVNANGVIACASSGQGLDVSDRTMYRQMKQDPRTRVTISADGVVSRTSVIIVSVPVMRDDVFDGFVAVSLPHGSLFRPTAEITGGRPLDLITYNADAEILTSNGGLDGVEARLPARLSMAELVMAHEIAFIDYTRAGDWRVFAVVPIVAGQVYALGSWSHHRDALVEGLSITKSLVFPVAMWLVCLGVAFLAVQRMVIRPTRDLRARMLTFMRSRRMKPARHDAATPRELREMQDTWVRLAENVLHDEAELYDTIHQRTVLLKEVHHRVKNNLQLIVSILNMKIRNAGGPEARVALSDIRQRVLGISRVHQNLYETSTAERVHAGELLEAIVGQTVRSGVSDLMSIRFTESYDNIVVYPDQAVPLSMAVTELLANALKNLGAAEGETPDLSVLLQRDGDSGARLEVCNSVAAIKEEDEQGSGLGLALVRAFTGQLEGTCKMACEQGRYCAVMRFPIADFDDGAPSKGISETA